MKSQILEDEISCLEQFPRLPSIETLIQLLQRCRKEKDQALAKRMLTYMQQKRLQGHKALGNYLVALLADCGFLHEARQVLDSIFEQNVYAYNALILGYIEFGNPQHVFHLYQKMQANGLQPTTYTYVALLKACGKLEDLDRGRQLRDTILKKGVQKDAFVGNALVGMFGKCGSMVEAQEAFDLMLCRDVVSWSSILAGYANQGDHEKAVHCFMQMQSQGVLPNVVTYMCSLKSCALLKGIEPGRHIYCEAVKMGLETDLSVGNTSIDMFCKCDCLLDAQEIFDKLSYRDMVSWNALISGYVEQGLGKQAFALFQKMELHNWPLDNIAFMCGLRACASTGSIRKGQRLHSDIVKRGIERDGFLGNTLVDMLGKCGLLEEAVLVFDNLPERDAVSWSALIVGNSQHGFDQEALNYFGRMQSEGISPDAVVFACSLKACCNLGATTRGQAVHSEITKFGFENDVHIGSVLVDMYGEFVLLSEARKVFDELPVRNLMSWTALIKGFGINHEGPMALQCFQDMQEEGLRPDPIAYTSLLVACSHTSLVVKGQEYFQIIEEETENLRPNVYHFSCIVDLLARAGHVNEAARVLETLKCPPSKEMWKALLSACRLYGEVKIGDRCFKHLMELNADDASAYAMMVDIYKSARKYKDAENLESRKLKLSVKTMNAFSFEEMYECVGG